MPKLTVILLLILNLLSCQDRDEEIEPVLEIAASENETYFEARIKIINNTGNKYYFLNGPIHFSGYFFDYNTHSSENISPKKLNSINYFPISSPNNESKIISSNFIYNSVNYISKIDGIDTLELLIKLKKSYKRIFESSQFALAANIVLLEDEDIEELISKLGLVLNNSDDIIEYSQDFEAELLLVPNIYENTQRSERTQEDSIYLNTISIKDTVIIKYI